VVRKKEETQCTEPALGRFALAANKKRGKEKNGKIDVLRRWGGKDNTDDEEGQAPQHKFGGPASLKKAEEEKAEIGPINFAEEKKAPACERKSSAHEWPDCTRNGRKKEAQFCWGKRKSEALLKGKRSSLPPRREKELWGFCAAWKEERGKERRCLDFSRRRKKRGRRPKRAGPLAEGPLTLKLFAGGSFCTGGRKCAMAFDVLGQRGPSPRRAKGENTAVRRETTYIRKGSSQNQASNFKLMIGKKGEET